MKLYHTTSSAAADAILQSGFIDHRGTYGMPVELEGVWVADSPVDMNDGAQADDVVLELDLDLDGHELEAFEVREDPHLRRFREFCIPADVLNSKGTVRVRLEDDEPVPFPHP